MKLHSGTKWETKWPAIIFITAFAVRAVYFTSYLQTPFAEWYFADQAYYRAWAMRIAAGDFWGREVFEQTPLYPYLLALCYRAGVPEKFVIGAQLLAGAFGSVLVYSCGRRVFGLKTGIVAGLLAATFGPSIHYECALMKTFLSPLFTMVALYSALRYADRGALGWLFGSGLAIGLACLERENHVLLLASVLIWVWAENRSRRLRGAQRLAPLIVPVLGCGLAILPVTIRNYVVSGELVAVTTGGGEVFYIAHGPDATGFYRPPDWVQPVPERQHEDFRVEARRRSGRNLTRSESSRYWFRESMNEVLSHPERALLLTCKKAAILLNDFEAPDSSIFSATREFIPILRILPSFGWIVGPGLLGIWLCVFRWRQYLLPLGFVAAHVLSILITYNFGRFRVGLAPIWMLFAANGFVWIVEELRQPQRDRRRRALCGAAAAIAISVLSFLSPIDYGSFPFAEADRKMQEEVRDYYALRDERRRLEDQLARASKDMQLRMSLGDVLMKLKEPADAVEHYREAVRLAPRNATAQLGLGRALIGAGRAPEARQHFQQSLEYEPSSAETHEEFGQLWLGFGEVKRGVAELEQASRLKPASAAIHISLGLAYLQAGMPELAERALQAAIRIDPTDPNSHYYLALLYRKLGRETDAIDQVSEAVRLDPRFPQAHQLFLQLSDKRSRMR